MKVVLLPATRPVPMVLQRKPKKAIAPPPTKENDDMSSVNRDALARESEKKYGRPVRNTVQNKSISISQLWSFMELIDPKGTLASSAGCVILAGEPALEGGIDLGDIDVEAHNKRKRAEGTPEGVLDPEQVKSFFDQFSVLDLSGEPDDTKTSKGVMFTPYQLVEVAFSMGQHYAIEAQNRKALAPLLEKQDDSADDEGVFDEDEVIDADSAEEASDDDEDDDDVDFDEEDFDAEDDND